MAKTINHLQQISSRGYYQGLPQSGSEFCELCSWEQHRWPHSPKSALCWWRRFLRPPSSPSRRRKHWLRTQRSPQHQRTAAKENEKRLHRRRGSRKQSKSLKFLSAIMNHSDVYISEFISIPSPAV